ncbi:hypothetical protein ACSEUM_12965 [Pseudomonas aeruginosa]
MNIGFVNMFSFRPHVEHLVFMARLLEGAGHTVKYLTCDAQVSNCYPRAIKGTTKLKECPRCIIGGVRSYVSSGVETLVGGNASLSIERLDAIALSSSCTLNRTESEKEWNEPAVVAVRESLHQPVLLAYQSAVAWIERNQLDAVVCFNGRMDLTRAVTYACEQVGIPYVTHE